MAEVVDEMPKNGRHRSKYERFLDGQVWRINAAEDFGMSTATVRTGVRTLAYRRGIRVITSTDDAGNLYVRAFPDGEVDCG